MRGAEVVEERAGVVEVDGAGREEEGVLEEPVPHIHELLCAVRTPTRRERT